MKIYSKTLTLEDLHRAARAIPALRINDRTGYGMASGSVRLIEGRKRRFEGVTLRAESSERPKNWRDLDESASEGGLGRSKSMPQHATYDEHGRWMARLFEIDPDARIVSAVNDFAGFEDFHSQTGGKYRHQLV